MKSVARFIKIQRLKKRCFFVSFSFVYFLPEFCAEHYPQFFFRFLFLTCIRVPWTRSGRRANMFNVYTRTRVPIGTLTSLSAYFYPEFCALRWNPLLFICIPTSLFLPPPYCIRKVWLETKYQRARWGNSRQMVLSNEGCQPLGKNCSLLKRIWGSSWTHDRMRTLRDLSIMWILRSHFSSLIKE